MSLLDKWPEFLQALAEFRALSDALSPEADAARAAVEGMAREFSAYTLSEWGVKRWEDILGLTGKDADDLNSRRVRIITKIIEQPPITKRVLYNQLRSLAGDGRFTMDIDYGLHKLEVKLDLGSKSAFEDVKALVERSAPADMVLSVSLLFNTHAMLGAYTHAALAAYTHEELRSEVFSDGG